MFLRQDPHTIAVLAETTSDDRQQYLAGVHYQQDTPEVAALCPIICFVEYHDDGIFPLLRYLPPLPIQAIISSSLRHRLRSPLTVILNSSTEPPDPSFADEFNVLKEYYYVYFLIFDVHQAAVLLPFQIHRLQVLACRFLNASFGFADEGPEKAQNGSFSSY